MGEAATDRLRDVLEHAEEALEYLEGVTQAQFRKDRRLQLATERLLEIVGEAAGALSDEARAAVPFDWKAVRGLRNVLSHQYGNIDVDLVYRVAVKSLPELIESTRNAVEDQ